MQLLGACGTGMAMNVTARGYLVGALITLLAPSPAAAQLSDQLPDPAYYLAVQSIYSGEYRDAERALRQHTRRGLQIGQVRWIDSICYHAMLGEVLFHQGRNAEALAEFDQACQLLLAYPNWLLQVKFQQPPRPDPNPAGRIPPWGQSGRQFTVAHFPPVEQVLIGDLDAQRALQEGGVAAFPMLWRVDVAEVVRTAALAIRRRSELLGPLAKHDRLSRDLTAALGRGNLAPPNHWSAAWIDLLRGVSEAGVGNLDQADKLFSRAVIIEGRFDHPLTCVVMLEQGRLQMARGNRRAAGELLAEASFSAYHFENWDVVTESLWLGWLNHLSGGGTSVYPPLEPAAAWAQANRLQHIAIKFWLAQAESLAWLGQLDAAAGLVENLARRMGDLRTGLAGIHSLYLQASLRLLSGDVAAGMEMLSRALAAQQTVSVRNFRIARANEMFDSGVVSPRVAVDLYGAILADPAPVDWVLDPLDSMAMLQTPQDAAFERWLLATMDRKDIPLAIEISERAKRWRYLSSQRFGGRLAALRTILEAPDADLSQEALLQRQQILTGFPAYGALLNEAQLVREKLRGGPVVAADPAEAKPLSNLYDQWEKNLSARARLLSQLAPRRLATAIEFPPLRTLPELQRTLRDGEALVVFHAAAGRVYGFVATQADVHFWLVRNPKRLRGEVSELLRSLGNYSASRTLSADELADDAWRQSASKMFETVLGDARLALDKMTALVIVPDDVLWHLPFETLIAPGGKSQAVLADRIAIRYGPTAALAVVNSRPLRRPRRTGIVANDLDDKEMHANGDAMVKELEKAVVGPVRLSAPLPEPGYLISPLLDGLVALDNIETRSGAEWSPLPPSRNRGESIAADLGAAGPERMVITGFATEAERGLKSSLRSAGRQRAGDEMFQSLCDMMAGGARTILLTRWRTGGRTNFELVREFVRELPQLPATEAWQRACVLARETPLEPTLEPRLKRFDEKSGEAPTANHPFFWAGYLLVDNSPRGDKTKSKEQAADEVVDKPEQGNPSPPGESQHKSDEPRP